MAKIGIFKKVAALATAIAIVVCFAASAGAVTVTTTTNYFGDKGDISVNVTIQDAEIIGKNVSYYASNNGVPVYIDQFDNFDGEENFSYVATDADLDSEVKVSYTDADGATEWNIDGDKVTWGTAEPVYIPTAATSATVKFPAAATSVTSYSAEGARITAEPVISNDGYLTVILDSISADKGDIKLTIATETVAKVELIDAAFVYSNGKDDIASGVDTEVNDRKLTAIGKVTGDPAEFGIIVTTDSVNYVAEDKYKAVASTVDVTNKTDDGYYAIQLIDKAANGEADNLLDSDSYFVAAYADETGDGADIDVSEFQSVTIENLN